MSTTQEPARVIARNQVKVAPVLPLPYGDRPNLPRSWAHIAGLMPRAAIVEMLGFPTYIADQWAEDIVNGAAKPAWTSGEIAIHCGYDFVEIRAITPSIVSIELVRRDNPVDGRYTKIETSRTTIHGTKGRAAALRAIAAFMLAKGRPFPRYASYRD